MTLAHDSRLDIAWRKAKVAVHSGRRLADHLRRPQLYPVPQFAADAAPFAHLHGERHVAVDRQDAAADPRYEDGKRRNLALAAPCFDGLVVGPDRPLSFWRTLGRVTAARGYAMGMELRGGCIVPALGGGLCLLSNALFALGAELGWAIAERHGHTMEAVPPPPDVPWGLDATVFWPYVDLRMAPRQEVRLAVRVADGLLRVQVHGQQPPLVRCSIASRAEEHLVIGGVRQKRNQLWRRTFDAATGQAVGEELLATNRKQLMHDWQQARHCGNCNETGCLHRAELLG